MSEEDLAAVLEALAKEGVDAALTSQGRGSSAAAAPNPASPCNVCGKGGCRALALHFPNSPESAVANAAAGAQLERKARVTPDEVQLEILRTLRRLKDDDTPFGGDGGGEKEDSLSFAELKEYMEDHGEELAAAYKERWENFLTEGEDRPLARGDAMKAIKWNQCTTAQKAWWGYVAVLRILDRVKNPPPGGLRREGAAGPIAQMF